MNDKKVLVLGGNGFIGTNLCNNLRGLGYSVYSFDRVLPQESGEGITYIEGDFFDDNTLKKAVSEKDVIIHAISTITPGNSNTEYMRGYQKDFIQSVKLCELARDNEAKLIFLSSGGTVYGIQEQLPIKEDTLPHPINHYGNIKLCIENTMISFKYQNNMDIAIARIANPYGPGQDSQKGVGFIDAVIKNALSGNAVDVYGDGLVVRDYIYIDDVCKAIASLIDHKIEGLPIVNISTGVGVTINEILDIVKEIHGHLKVNYKEARTVDLERVVLDNSKIRKIVGEDFCDLRDGIEKYYQYIKAERWKR